MVSPVTGPFSKSQIWTSGSSGSNADSYVGKRWFRQKPPFTLPLEYQMNRTQVTRSKGAQIGYATIGRSWQGDLLVDARNLARSKLMEKLKSDSSSILVTLAERKQAKDMITKRALQLYRLGRVEKLRRSSFRREARSAAGNYLEFHFGWVPMIKDIGNAVNTLQKGVPPERVRATGRASKLDSDNRLVLSNRRINDRTFYDVKVQYGCDAVISNSDLWLANQLGFINPLTVAWELVPYSFVVDWFVNVQEFLTQGTDTIGLSIANRYATSIQKADVFHLEYDFVNGNENSRTREVFYTGWDHRMDRQLSWPSVSLGLRPPKAWGYRRALAAISLLIQKGL